MYKYDYQEFYRRVKNGDILIVVDPAMARKFYFEMDTSSLMKVIGEDLLNESFLNSDQLLIIGAVIEEIQPFSGCTRNLVSPPIIPP